MTYRCRSMLLSAFCLLAAWAAAPLPAQAELDACGGIFLSGDAACEYRPTEECMTECMTVAVESSCVAKLFTECESSCAETATTECESGCTETCTESCTTTTAEAPPSCMELCTADCDESCGGQDCDPYEHKGACGRCCKHGCQKRCEESCEGMPPPAEATMTECMPICTTACSASCTATANTTCQVDCQENVYVECEQEMVEQCETDCKQTGGAIFCDGQFINAENAQSCADQIEANVSIKIDIDAALEDASEAVDETADDVGDKTSDTAACVDEKVCSVSNVGASQGSSALFALGGLGLALLWRRRRG